MMVKHIPFLLAGLAVLLSACSGLAGEVEIVATLPPANAVAPPAAPPDIANGARIYAQNCTACHGDNGAGNGPLVEAGDVPRMPSFLEGSHVRQQTPADYFNIITNGNLENLMPPWADALTEQERWDVAMYNYTLNYTPELLAIGMTELVGDVEPSFVLESDRSLAQTLRSSDPTLDLETAEAIIAAQRVQTLQNFGAEVIELPASVNWTINVSNGTASSDVPADLAVQLIYGDFAAPNEIAQAEMLLTENQAQFTDIPVDAAFDYIVLTQHNGVQFFSEPIAGSMLFEDQTVELDIFERIDAPASISLSAVDLFVEQLTVPDLGTGLVIRQTNRYDNAADRVYWTQPSADSPPVSLLVELPPGAFVIATGDLSSNRYVVSNDEGIILDTAPVYPGEHIIEFQYFVPYERGAIIDQALNVPLAGLVTVDLATSALRITSDTFTEVETDAPEIASRYQADLTVERRGSLAFEIAGSIFASENSSDDPTLITNDVLLPLLVIFIVGLVVLIVVLFWLQGRGSTEREINTLVQQLTLLETMRDAGQINHDVYRRQQKELQARLAALRGDASQEDPA